VHRAEAARLRSGLHWLRAGALDVEGRSLAMGVFFFDACRRPNSRPAAFYRDARPELGWRLQPASWRVPAGVGLEQPAPAPFTSLRDGVMDPSQPLHQRFAGRPWSRTSRATGGDARERRAATGVATPARGRAGPKKPALIRRRDSETGRASGTGATGSSGERKR